MKGLNPSTALGPDEHHPRVVKELATYMLPFYFVIYQSVLKLYFHLYRKN